MEPMIAKPTDLPWGALVPLFALAGIFVWNFLLEILRVAKAPSQAPFWTLLVGVFGIAYLIAYPEQGSTTAIHKMWIYDGMTRAASLIIFVCLTLVAIVVPRDIGESGHVGEYFALLSAAALGMVMLIGSNTLILVFLSLELFSLALYLLCIFQPLKSESQESGLKYFISSSLASAIILYGIALVYGATGSTWLPEISARVDQGGILLMVGSALLASGFAFKIAAVPFHVWSPDVYQGAPTSVTAFMSVATKTAALVALFRFFPVTLGPASSPTDMQRIHWWIILWSLAILSMLMGNLMALCQTNLKRMLAYSGIAQAGYLLTAVFAGTPQAQRAMIYYLLVYAFMNIGAFLVVSALEEVGEDLSFASLAGLSMRQPVLSGALAVFLFSLTGLPPTAGFFAKFSLFGSLLNSPGGLLPRYLVAAGLLGSLLSAGYYLRAVAQVYAPGPAPEPQKSIPVAFWIAIGLCLTGVFALALAAQPTLAWIQTLLLGSVGVN